MYDVMEPPSSRGEDDWNRDIENNQPYPSTLSPRRDIPSADAAKSLPYTDVPSYSSLQPATNMRERVDVVPGPGIAIWGRQKLDEVGRERKVKSVRIELPTPAGTRAGNNFGDSRDNSASVYELLSPQLRAEAPFSKPHSQPQFPPPSPQKRSSRASKRPRPGRPRSVSLGQSPLPSRIDIPNSQSDTVVPSSSQHTSGSLLMSPVRRRRQSRRSSLTYQSVSAMEPSPVTISTINFTGPKRESAFSQISLDDHRHPSLPAETPSGDLLTKLKTYREI